MENINKYPTITNLNELDSFIDLILDIDIDDEFESQIWMDGKFINNKNVNLTDIKKKLHNDLKYQLGNIKINTKHSHIILDNISSISFINKSILAWIRLVILASAYDVKIAVISLEEEYVFVQMIMIENFKNKEIEKHHIKGIKFKTLDNKQQISYKEKDEKYK